MNAPDQHAGGRVLYLHLGGQCPFGLYMRRGAEEAARILNMEFESRDVSREPDLAREHGMFFPGMIVIDGDFRVVHPVPGEHIAELYRIRGPLPGEMKYVQRPPAPVTHIAPLTPGQAREMAGVCLSSVDDEGVRRKRRWLEDVGGTAVGYLGRVGSDVVAVVELVPESDIPYPIPSTVDGGLFITCLYGRPATVDYRQSLLTRALINLARRGVTRVSAVAGAETPYPNGPLSVFRSCGFAVGPRLDRALFRHRWEDLYFVTRDLRRS